jgi:hypothetical protein
MACSKEWSGFFASTNTTAISVPAKTIVPKPIAHAFNFPFGASCATVIMFNVVYWRKGWTWALRQNPDWMR